MVEARCFTSHGWRLTPDAEGWMYVMFPFPSLAARENAWNYMREAQLMCPSCGVEVAKFIAHRRTPMLGDEDLIG